MRSRLNAGRRLLLSTFLLVGLSGVGLVLAIHSIGQLLKAFDLLYVILLVASGYATIIGVYSTATIFYNVDKINGRQKRTVRFLELSNKGKEVQ